MSNPSQLDLRSVEEEELFGEIRRRQISEYTLRRKLGINDYDTVPVKQPVWANMKFVALIVLAALSLILVGFIGYLSVAGANIPDLLSGLAGSTIGAIVGILSAGGGDNNSDTTKRGSPMPSA